MTEPAPADLMRAAADRLADIWPDPMGRWTAEQADAARQMKAALLAKLGKLPERREAPAVPSQRPQERPEGPPAAPASPHGAPEAQAGTQRLPAVEPGGNAEDCLRCTAPNPPYPFLCPGHPEEDAPAPPAALREELAHVWPDPFGRWTAEQADAATAMKAAVQDRIGPLLAERDRQIADMERELATCTAPDWRQRAEAAEAAIQRVRALLPDRREDDTAASWLSPRQVRNALDGQETPAP